MSQPIQQQKFTPRAFRDFLGEIHVKISEIRTTSWKDLVRRAFSLDAAEEKSLAQTSKEQWDELQSDFVKIAEHLNSGGKVDDKIIENENKTHTILIFWETKELFVHSIVIVCCDANCRNWKWGKRIFPSAERRPLHYRNGLNPPLPKENLRNTVIPLTK